MIWTFLATAGGFLKRIPLWAYVAVAAVIGVILWGNHRYDEGRADELAVWVAAQAAAKAKADKATVDAAEDRATDTIRNTEAERARNEATVTGGRIGRDCERLRQAGADLSSIAACAGR